MRASRHWALMVLVPGRAARVPSRAGGGHGLSVGVDPEGVAEWARIAFVPRFGDLRLPCVGPVSPIPPAA